MSRFKDEEYLPAVEKEKILGHWLRFLKNGLRREDFTKALYNHIYQNCDFIAHYDIHRFYEYYFEQGSDRITFLQQFDRARGCRAAEGGTTYWINDSYADLANAMVDEAAKYLPVLYAQGTAAQRQADLRQAEILLGRCGLELAAAVKPMRRENTAVAVAGTQANLFF